MAAIPQPLSATVQAIYNLHEARQANEPARSYLGASEIGEACERKLWLRFRWAKEQKFEGRMLRLFDSGHREEARVIDELKALGFEVRDRGADGQQIGAQSHGGHMRGHVDVIARGLLEAPKTWHLIDVKTIKTAKYEALLKNGIQKEHPKYYAQGQWYMGKHKLERAAFIFVNKDDDHLHLERFDFNPEFFAALDTKAGRIIFTDTPPQGISTDPAWYECKLCEMHGICHADALPKPSCRTCLHVTPTQEGAWMCERYKLEVAGSNARSGCEDHRFIPILLHKTASAIDASEKDNTVTYQATNSRQFVNGQPPEHYSSAELWACQDKSLLGAKNSLTEAVDEARRELEARIVG